MVVDTTETKKKNTTPFDNYTVTKHGLSAS
jgi:hypothetical protein